MSIKSTPADSILKNALQFFHSENFDENIFNIHTITPTAFDALGIGPTATNLGILIHKLRRNPEIEGVKDRGAPQYTLSQAFIDYAELGNVEALRILLPSLKAQAHVTNQSLHSMAIAAFKQAHPNAIAFLIDFMNNLKIDSSEQKFKINAAIIIRLLVPPRTESEHREAIDAILAAVPDAILKPIELFSKGTILIFLNFDLEYRKKVFEFLNRRSLDPRLHRLFIQNTLSGQRPDLLLQAVKEFSCWNVLSSLLTYPAIHRTWEGFYRSDGSPCYAIETPTLEECAQSCEKEGKVPLAKQLRGLIAERR